MQHLLVCPLMDTACSIQDLSTANGIAIGCAKHWEGTIWRTYGSWWKDKNDDDGRQLATTKRVDVIRYRYLPDRCKSNDQTEEGSTNQTADATWREWEIKQRLVVYEKRKQQSELFHYLSVSMAQTVWCEGKVVIIYYQLWMKMYRGVLCQALTTVQAMQPWWVRYENDVACSECSVARLVVHTYYCEQQSHWHNRAGVSFFVDIGVDKLWDSFEIGNKLRNISMCDICSTMSSAD